MPQNLEFMDSFGHYTSATAYQKYNNPNGLTIGSGDGRFGANSHISGPSRTSVTFKRNLTTIYAAIAFICPTGQALGQSIFDLLDGLGFGAGKAFTDSVGRVYVQLALGTTVGGTFSIFHDVWYHAEVFFNVDIAGEVTIKINEVTVATVSGDNRPRAFNGTLASYVYATAISLPSSGLKCSDFIVNIDHYFGDAKVRYIKPNAVGTDSAWTPNTAVAQWTVLDEVPPNGDSDYIYTAGINDITTVNMEDVTLDGTCLGIQVLCSMKKDEANVRKAKTVVLEGGTYNLGDEESLPTEYHYLRTCWDLNPRTGIAWTTSDLTAAQGGVKLTA